MERVAWKLTLPYVKVTNGNLLCGGGGGVEFKPRGVG